ncbi:hypothetical protein [Kitasatospora acidiphila]|uniref:hypothetical protein n=1 Tax=Kitasatospora acidiphila TaxID=2567942 RepID=UPI003C770305
MQWWQAGLWGALGSVLVELADLRASVQARRQLPWKGRGSTSPGLYLLAAVVRTVLGIGVAVALGESGQVSGGFGAILSGIAAPKILEALKSQAAPGVPGALPGPEPTPRENKPPQQQAQPGHEVGSARDAQ